MSNLIKLIVENKKEQTLTLNSKRAAVYLFFEDALFNHVI
jgi:hypothetical protein